MKDAYLKIMIEKELKEEFIKACDGRTASVVIRKFIKEYIRRTNTREHTK